MKSSLPYLLERKEERYELRIFLREGRWGAVRVLPDPEAADHRRRIPGRQHRSEAAVRSYAGSAAAVDQNQWLDEQSRVYIIYTIEDIMSDMHCGNQKAVKMLSELEKKVGLIRRKRQGLGKPSLIYVMKFSTIHLQSSSESHFSKCDNYTSEDVKSKSQEVWNSHGNNIDLNQTENNKKNPINLSGRSVRSGDEPVEKQDGIDEMEMRQRYIAYFEKKLEVETLKDQYKWETGRIDKIIVQMADVMGSHAKTIRIGGEDRPLAVVQSRFMKLTYDHALYVMECMDENTSDVRNIKAYMLTSLYNAPVTIDSYYRAKVNHDMYGYAVNQGGE